jgi:hypothetical protein
MTQRSGSVARSQGLVLVVAGLLAGAAGAGQIPHEEGASPLAEMRGRLQRVANREAHRAIQESRRAALDAYRDQIRLLTPEALAAARREAVDWSAPDSRARAETAASEVYARGEAEARLAGIEASERAWRAGYARARQAALRIAEEYRRELDDEIRKAAVKAMLDAYRKGGRDRAQRAVAERDARMAEMRREAAQKVAAKLASAERAEFAKLQQEADRRGLVAYQVEEAKAYAEAVTSIEADQPATTEWRDEGPVVVVPRGGQTSPESWLMGMVSSGR